MRMNDAWVRTLLFALTAAFGAACNQPRVPFGETCTSSADCGAGLRCLTNFPDDYDSGLDRPVEMICTQTCTTKLDCPTPSCGVFGCCFSGCSKHGVCAKGYC